MTLPPRIFGFEVAASSRHVGRRAMIVFAVTSLAALASPTALATGNGVFGSVESVSTDLKPFPKWTDTLKRYFKEKGAVGGDCNAKDFNRCHYEKWMTFLNSVRNKSRGQQLGAVNDFMNRNRYIVDPINWGVKDYWATPGQFLKKFGDCEDYAIAKYMSLRELDWDADIMRIVIVQDMNLRIPHAILMVREGGKNMILDNQITIVVEDLRIRHYRPIYSVNENRWWRHKAG